MLEKLPARTDPLLIARNCKMSFGAFISAYHLQSAVGLGLHYLSVSTAPAVAVSRSGDYRWPRQVHGGGPVAGSMIDTVRCCLIFFLVSGHCGIRTFGRIPSA